MKTDKPNNGPPFRVLLVDQDAAFGSRLAQALEGPSGFRLCGCVLDAAAAETAVAETNPELVVADTDPDRTGALPLLCRLAAASPAPPLLATSRRCEPAEAELVLRAGAGGLLLKTEPVEEILAAFRTVIQGQVYVSRAFTMPLLKRLLSEPPRSPRRGVDSLTDRELRVFELLGLGLSKREVAAQLGLSCKTVDSHRAKIQRRLGLESAVALAQFACGWAQRDLRAARPPLAVSALGERALPQRQAT